MTQRTLEAIIAPRAPHYVGDGFRVHNFIPSTQPLSMRRMSPFILLDYNAPFYFPPSDQLRGVGVHPHRGFETVTIAYKGRVAHRESSGGGIIGEGDVQWMTAASGILHKEYHEENFSKTGGFFQIVQLWVNLPARYKMSAPKYQAIAQHQINSYQLPNNGGTVAVIAGQYADVQGAATTFTPMHLYNAHLKAGTILPLSFPSHYNTALLVVAGNIRINGGENVPTNHFALLRNNGEDFSVTANDDALVLVLSGEPIDEPIAAQGPFVMNTPEELAQARRDFAMGKFGQLED